jgi:hypothetical protein
MRFALFSILVVALLSVTRPAAAAPAETDPCRLVTRAEAKDVLGASVSAETSPPPRQDRNVRICSIRGENGRTLTVFVGSRTKDGFDHEKKGHTPVSGIGDDGYAVPPGIVAIRKGETVLLLSMSVEAGPEEAGLLERVKRLARAAVGRL